MKTKLLFLCLAAASAAPVMAQVAFQPAAGVRFESYSFSAAEKVGIDHVTLFTTPVTARIGFTRQLELQVTGAFARGSVQRAGGSEETLSGPIDTEVRLTAALAQDRVRISAVGLIPTGKSELTPGEMDVAGVIAADMLPFAISNWGAGGGLGLSAAAALPVNDEMTVGLSAGYVVAREFEPTSDNSFAYRPGNQLQVRAGMDRTFGVSGKFSLGVTYLQYGADEGSGTNFYQAGDRLQALASYAFAAGANATAIVYGGFLHRGEGQYTTIVLITPAQNVIFGGTGVRVPVGSAVLQPALDLRVLGSDDGVEHGYTLSAGTSIELPLGSALVVPQLKARFGNLTVRSGAESGFVGFDAGVSIRGRRVQP